MTGIVEKLRDALGDRYVVERELGAGGMATVYLSRDVKHDRLVALKVLRPDLAAVIGADRFLAEIKTTANLQHPHILPLHDSGEAGGLVFYVMPYVEGESLRERLEREKQLPVADAVRIASEVADALDYAHRHGVIHRDIKPENILLHDGRALVADFGIALAVSKSDGGTRMTETGMSLGTPHYMSPEQAMGERDLDARSDVYALGCVLYEMLTGEPPFTGPTAQAIVAKVLTAAPEPLIPKRHTIPPNVQAVVLTALEKLPADRFASAADFASALANTAFASTAAPAPSVAPSASSARPARRTSGLTVALAAVALIASAIAAWGWLRPPEPRLVSRFSLNLEGADIGNAVDAPVISPDGRKIVYSVASGGFIVRDVGALTGSPIPDFENVWTPFFSPDGLSVAFMTGFPGDLVVLELAGGSPTTVVRGSAMGWGGAWSDDGWLYFTSGGGATLMRVRPTGGTPERVAGVDTTKDELYIRYPRALPGGDKIVVTLWRKRGAPDVALVDVGSGEVRVLRRGVRVFYAPTGQLIVAEGDGTLWAVPFDVKRGQLSGSPVQVLDGLRVLNGGTIQLALSESGTLLYSRYRPNPRVVRVTRTGAASAVDPNWSGQFGGLALSPDGTRLAVDQVVDGRGEIWVKTLDTGPTTRVALGGTLTYRPFWSPDGRWIGFLSDMNGTGAAYRAPADGSGAIERLMTAPQAVDEGEWSRDGRWLVLRLGSGGGRDIYALQVGVDSTPRPVVATEFDDYSPALSPDGRWLAYGSNVSGRDEVYVRPFPDARTERTQISIDGGAEPAWSHSGRELFYRDAEGMFVAVSVAAGSTFRVTGRQRLFSAIGYRSDTRNRAYAVSRDDQSFLFVDPQSAPTSEMVVVLNWFEELKSLMDGRR